MLTSSFDDISFLSSFALCDDKNSIYALGRYIFSSERRPILVAIARCWW